MSITVTTDIVCDECGDWRHGVSGMASAAKAARAEVHRRYGFRRIDGKDLCAKCVAARSWGGGSGETDQ